ncbi:MAG: transglycosylase SLT domain-containing protein [Gemmatimonadota bacterium]
MRRDLLPAGHARGAVTATLLLLLLGTGLVGKAAAQRPTERYDQTFRKYSKRYFGVGFDWRVFKAQGLTESNLNPAATSWVGAKGIMQLMPSTFLEIQTKNPDWTSIDDVEWNIAAGISYNRRLWRLWKDSVDTEDHRYFMFGSYNAGRIPILRAQGVARQKLLDPRYWASIEVVAPEVRGWRQSETISYVRRIRENLERLDDRGRVIRPARTP